MKSDRDHAAQTLATALSSINAIKTLLHPVIPFTTATLHEDLGFAGTIGEQGWTFAPIAAGTQLRPARPLYTKIETAPPGAAGA